MVIAMKWQYYEMAVLNVGINEPTPNSNNFMINWAITFLVIALIAAVLGFGGIAGTAVGIAKIVFLVFIVLCIIAFVMGRKTPPV